MTDPKGPAVYCVHQWDPFGPAFRCRRCWTIWKKLEDPKEPEIIIGHVELPPPQE